MSQVAPRPAGPPRDAGPAGWAPWASRAARAITLAVALAGLIVVAWCALTAWAPIVHGHPLYPVLLGLTLVISVYAIWRGTRRARSSVRPRRRSRLLRVLAVLAVVLAGGWVGVMGWLRPFTAAESATSAMASTSSVSVVESATAIALTPAAAAGTAVFFQPGARVDARAYTAVLRPLAEAGHLVVIAKQPVGIAFLATGAFDTARASYPQVRAWVVAGHSLGGTVAAMAAADHDSDATAPVVGLLLFASYPASDLSGSLTAAVLSISAANDGLATPDKIQASRAILPANARYLEIPGAVHAYFGDYGAQPGDGVPSVGQDRAREQIAAASVEFVRSLTAR